MSQDREDRRPDRGSWLFRGSETGASGPETGVVEPHLDDETLAALLESAAEGADEATREHLARCDRCRREWLELLDAVESIKGVDRLARVPRRIERRAVVRGDVGSRPQSLAWLAWLMPSPALAGALAAILIATGFVLLLPVSEPALDDDGTVRSENTADLVELLRPRGPIKSAGELIFDWTPVPGATGYQVVVADLARGSETVLRLDAARPPRALGPGERALLLPGRPYRWLLRVERGAGRVVTSDPAGFVLKAPSNSQ